METIKACPCCGGEGKLKDIQGRRIRQGWVGCPACGLYINWKISPEGAIKKWNRRAAETFSVSLTKPALLLLKYFPEAVNELAERMKESLYRWVLYGEGGGEADGEQ